MSSIVNNDSLTKSYLDTNSLKKEEEIKVAEQTSSKSKVDLLNAKIHGTTSSTLHMMGVIEGEQRHSLIPLGNLMKMGVPCFSGECHVGIKGVNKVGTSWTSNFEYAIDNYAKDTDFYADRKSTIQWLDKTLEMPESPFQDPVYGMHANNPLFWSKFDLKVRRYRALSTKDTESETLNKISKWLDSAIKHINKYKKFDESNKELYEESINKIEEIILSLKEEKVFRLTKDTQEAIEKPFPIAFVSLDVKDDEVYESGDHEYCVQRNMKLGRDIQYIATESAHVSKVQSYLKENGLFDKVFVLTFDTLLKAQK